VRGFRPNARSGGTSGARRYRVPLRGSAFRRAEAARPERYGDIRSCHGVVRAPAAGLATGATPQIAWVTKCRLTRIPEYVRAPRSRQRPPVRLRGTPRIFPRPLSTPRGTSPGDCDLSENAVGPASSFHSLPIVFPTLNGSGGRGVTFEHHAVRPGGPRTLGYEGSRGTVPRDVTLDRQVDSI